MRSSPNSAGNRIPRAYEKLDRGIGGATTGGHRASLVVEQPSLKIAATAIDYLHPVLRQRVVMIKKLRGRHWRVLWDALCDDFDARKTA